MSLGERILTALSRDPRAADYPGGTLTTNIDNALDFVCKTVPGFETLIRGQVVLDFGCGWGWQATAMVRGGAARVVGLDIVADCRERARQTAARFGVSDRVTVVDRIPDEMLGTFDVVLSCSSIEHVVAPGECLRQMRDAARPDGRIIISFAEPWYSPHGAHVGFFTHVPWANLLFSESTVMRVRSRYRADGAARYDDVEGGLNRMSVARFERIIRESGLRVEFMKCYAVKNLPLVTRVPVVRELLTAAVACILRNDAAAPPLSATDGRHRVARSDRGYTSPTSTPVRGG